MSLYASLLPQPHLSLSTQAECTRFTLVSTPFFLHHRQGAVSPITELKAERVGEFEFEKNSLSEREKTDLNHVRKVCEVS